MMRLVIDNDNVLFIAQIPADPAHGFIRRLDKRIVFVPNQNIFGQPARVACLTGSERMEIRYDNRGFSQICTVFRRHNVHFPVVILRIIRQQHTETVPDGDAGRDNEKRV